MGVHILPLTESHSFIRMAFRMDYIAGPAYDLLIFKQVVESIDAVGYLPQSRVRARAISRMAQINISH